MPGNAAATTLHVYARSLRRGGVNDVNYDSEDAREGIYGFT